VTERFGLACTRPEPFTDGPDELVFIWHYSVIKDAAMAPVDFERKGIVISVHASNAMIRQAFVVLASTHVQQYLWHASWDVCSEASSVSTPLG
jgi:hypothetical protein